MLLPALQNGLLTKCDRESSQIQSNYNGSAFGDGIYTCSNPDDFTRYGNVGLIVAQMQGRLEEVSSKYAKNRQRQVWSGDTGIAQNKSPMYADMRVLRESSQCLPLVRYDTSAVTQTNAGRRALYQFHRQLQRLVDDFFNGGATTSVPEYKKVLENATSTPLAATIPTINQASGVAGVSSATASQSVKDRDAKKQKETFLLFTRVLIKYLEQKDPNVHQQVKAIIKDCADRNKRGEQGYESVTVSMRLRLKRVVSESYWGRAEAYLRQLLSQKRSAVLVPPQNAPAAKTSNQMPNQGVAVTAGAMVDPNQGDTVAAAAGLAQKSATAPVRNMQNQCQALCTLAYTAPECLSSSAAENRMVVLEKDEIPKEECAICMAWLESPAKDKIDDTATLNDITTVAVEGCGHKFHLSCIQEALQHNSRCPTCRQRINEPQGTMPSGTMRISLSPRSCGGYPGTGTIVLSYNLEGGIQKVYHPNPGTRFGSCHRTAYIPDCHEGRQLLKRLQYAFLRGMSFVVGRSLTTCRDNVITWSSIHHKSSMRGGVHGFPDPSYFENCNEELDALGVPKAADLD